MSKVDPFIQAANCKLNFLELKEKILQEEFEKKRSEIENEKLCIQETIKKLLDSDNLFIEPKEEPVG